MDLTRQISSVMVVVGLLVALIAAGRRKGWVRLSIPAAFRQPGGGTRQLEVLERISIGANQTLALVRCGDRCLLIAVSPGKCECIETGLEKSIAVGGGCRS